MTYENRIAAIFTLAESAAAICPRVVAGRRCRVAWRPGAVCMCEGFRDLLDHARIWRAPGGGHVLTAEPYEIDPERFEAFAEALGWLNLEAIRRPESIWNPGRTKLIIVRRRRLM